MSMLAERRRKTKWVVNPTKKPLWTTDSDGIKFSKGIMEKMGWSAGKGLGANEQGIQEPLKVSYKNDTKGMGFKGNDEDWIEHQDEFNSFLNELSNSNETFVVKASDAEKNEVKSLEEKSKVSKARVHYQKFTRGKDLSRYSENDLACILGTNKTKKKEETTTDEITPGDSKLANELETNFGVTTINSGSMQDYFKKKWIIHKKNSGRPGVGEEATHDEGEVEKDCFRKRKHTSEDFETMIPHSDEFEGGEKKKKKKKKDRDLSLQEEPENKRRKQSSDNDLINNNLVEEDDNLRHMKRKSKDDGVENEINLGAVDEELSSKKKRKKHATDLVVSENVNDAHEEVELKKRKKKKKEKRDTFKENEDVPCVNGDLNESCVSQSVNGVSGKDENVAGDAEISSKKKKKKSKKEKFSESDKIEIVPDPVISNESNLGIAEPCVEAELGKKKKKKKDKKEIEEVECSVNCNELVTHSVIEEKTNEETVKKKKKKDKKEKDEVELLKNSETEIVSELVEKKKKKKNKEDKCVENGNNFTEVEVTPEVESTRKKKKKSAEKEEAENLENSESNIGNSSQETEVSDKKKTKKSKKAKLVEEENCSGQIVCEENTEETVKKKKKKDKKEKLLEKEETELVESLEEKNLSEDALQITSGKRKKKKKKDKTEEESGAEVKKNSGDDVGKNSVEPEEESKTTNKEEKVLLNGEAKDKEEQKTSKTDGNSGKNIGFSSNNSYSRNCYRYNRNVRAVPLDNVPLYRFGFDPNSLNIIQNNLGYNIGGLNFLPNSLGQVVNHPSVLGCSNGILNVPNNNYLNLVHFLNSYNYLSNVVNLGNIRTDGVQNHKVELLEEKKADKFYPGQSRSERVMRLLHMSDFSEFKGSNLERLIGYGLQGKINHDKSR